MQAVLATDHHVKVSVAANPVIALAKIERDPPDVVITDLEMPRMDGLTFIKKIMALHPLPVIVCSGLTEKRMGLAITALELGAVEVISKPQIGVRDFLYESAITLLDAVRSAAQARVVPASLSVSQPTNMADVVLPLGRLPRTIPECDSIIAVGASTGGTEAIRSFLQGMPTDCPAIVIVQHMPEMFTRAFADRLNKDCAIEVKEAAEGDQARSGRALIAPGNRHLVLRRSGVSYFVQIDEGPLVSRHRPSVDVLFRSVAKTAGRNAVGVLMTGMGSDGAQGLLEMRNAGAHTIAQDEASCVVFGMPKEAINRGAAATVLPLSQLARAALNA
jgi:two-component system chemotaxis response regulator CheB